MRRALLGLPVLLLAAHAVADEVPPPPDDCPSGQRGATDHQGPYCQPPAPASCPPGHTPKVRRTLAYCEPPPPTPCPRGSFWTSSAAADTWCQGGYPCRDDAFCGAGACAESALCVHEVEVFRAGSYEVVSGPCPASGTCPEGDRCVTARRCQAPAPLVASPPAATPPAARKGGCSVGAPGGLSGGLVLLGLGLVLLRRRAR
jgi:MYXO-CTERM domain-containing protein